MTAQEIARLLAEQQGGIISTAPTITITYGETYSVDGPTSTESVPLPPTTTTFAKVATGTPYNPGGRDRAHIRQRRPDIDLDGR